MGAENSNCSFWFWVKVHYIIKQSGLSLPLLLLFKTIFEKTSLFRRFFIWYMKRVSIYCLYDNIYLAMEELFFVSVFVMWKLVSQIHEVSSNFRQILVSNKTVPSHAIFKTVFQNFMVLHIQKKKKQTNYRDTKFYFLISSPEHIWRHIHFND